ncbi:hypothetical protein [Vibrio aestuarianus]|uniref:hypothetical protein n=1 Tax=Vibrio aestuarianus TaxID=28171 RepID=UPI00237D01A9|nr:hypothetical protein [Vibrio aestuarianus]EHR6685987.1 hypothetical protein [Vibrio parahaemolyticus]EHR6714581.1 hypothetical protein [Vibrio parahaemolyticus]MDE1211475.1 hypothetical protein [Vibrio aestuarianus]
MLKGNMFVRLHQDCFKNANKKQNELYSNLTVLQMKIMLSMLAYANMINSTNKHKSLITKFRIELIDIRKKGCLFENIKLSKNDFAETTSEIKHPYFESIIATKDAIEFKLNKMYVIEMNTAKCGYVYLKELMKYRSINQIKMHLQVAYFRTYKIPFYFAVNFLNISKNQSRKDKIRAIKNIFKSLNIKNECEYIFPKAREPKSNLHYNFVVKINDNSNCFDDNIFF